MKKWLLLLTCCSVGLSGVVRLQMPSGFGTDLVYAAERRLDKPLMSIGHSLTEEQATETKRLLGDTGMANEDILRVDGKVIAKYLDDVDAGAQIFSSAYIKPMDKGYGVQVEIVTPSKITKVSSATFQNAAITSGITDVLVRVASVNEVSGEGALAGIYALLEGAGIELDQESVQVGQNEVGLIDGIKSETGLTDSEANKLMGQLKKAITEKTTKKEKISDDWLKKAIEKAFKDFQKEIGDALKGAIVDWLKDFSATEVAQKKATIQQLEQSLLSEEWTDLLAGFDKVLSKEEILDLPREDYSDTKVYPAILQKLYGKLLKEIKAGNLATIKLIYTHTFVLEKLFGTTSEKVKVALNYLRMLCYYAVASAEDSQLPAALKQADRPSWLVFETTKANWLHAIERYKQLAQLPELQEIINRIGIATGYAYEVFLFEDIAQKGDIVTATISCPCLEGQKKIKVRYNVKTGQCQIKGGKKNLSQELYDFKGLYGSPVENNYQKLVDDISQYRILAEDKLLFSLRARNRAARLAYKAVLMDHLAYIKGELNLEEQPLLNQEHLVMEDLRTKQNFYYGIVDTNGDGLEELVVTDAVREKIIGFYSFDGSQVHFVGGTGYRSDLQIFRDGFIVNAGSGGAYLSGATLYRMQVRGSELEKHLSVDKEYRAPDFDAITYTVTATDGTTKQYDSEEAFVQAHPDTAPYFSVGVRKIVEIAEQADILDTSDFLDASTLESDGQLAEEAEEEEIEEHSETEQNLVETERESLWSRVKNGLKRFWQGLTSSEKQAKKVSFKALKRAYQGVLDEYAQVIELPIEKAEAKAFHHLNEVQVKWFSDYKQRYGDIVFYAYEDLNRDGLVELIVADKHSENHRVVGIYTYDQNQVVNLMFSELEAYSLDLVSGFNLYKDGLIHYYMEASASTVAHYFGKIEDGRLELIDHYESDGKILKDALTGEVYSQEETLRLHKDYIDRGFGKMIPEPFQTRRLRFEALSQSVKQTNQTKKAKSKDQADPQMTMKEEEIDRGDYSSVLGYWESDLGDLWFITETGLGGEEPGFKGLRTGETRKLDDIHETEYFRTRAEDNHLMDVVAMSRGTRTIHYKYVPKGSRYSPTWYGEDSEYLTAEEDMILTVMNGTDGVYAIYRRAEHGEAKAIIRTHLIGGGLLFSVPTELVLPSTYPDNINVHRLDMRDVLDYYNTHYRETYSLEMVLDDLGSVERRSGKASELSISDLEEIQSASSGMEWLYFEGDQQLILTMGHTGHAGSFPKAAPVSDWEIKGDTIRVPVLTFDGRPHGEIILKKNKKNYKGGRKRSSYYVDAYREKG
ncbi:uncharacterized protein YpuA (DUF1002 family) [Streptococcus rupicaprae]|uniref:Uncharacterized protein YpuA (DUF1002 family) n=1 Tax=Streptococcus rupicaprae TaxID=759619 RepID=A0ABV2FIQ3_9STRE